MSGSDWARLDRQETAQMLREVGPDAPTLCGGWTTHDLAAHLVLREARPDAALGIAVSFVSGWTDRVQKQYEKRDFDELVTAIEQGPPLLSPFSLPGADRIANTSEYFVHLEDIRRAQPDWQPRELPQAYRDALWAIVKQRGRMLLRNSAVGIDIVRTDSTNGEPRVTPVRKSPTVTVSGPAPELLLFAFGRKDHCELEFAGNPDDIRHLMGSDFSV